MLDWHAGLTTAMTAWGATHRIERDWHALANEHRRRSLRRMTNTVDPAFNIDDVHRAVVSEVFDENGLSGSAAERHAIAGRSSACRYRRRVTAHGLEPHDIPMVACHNFDLDAARGVGYRTAFVRRTDEWAPPGRPTLSPTLPPTLSSTGLRNSSTASAPEAMVTPRR